MSGPNREVGRARSIPWLMYMLVYGLPAIVVLVVSALVTVRAFKSPKTDLPVLYALVAFWVVLLLLREREIA